MPSLFLSHTGADKDRARAICHGLIPRKIDVWFDEAEIKPGDTLLSRIEPAIAEVDCLAVVLSPSSVSSEWVLTELRTAQWTQLKGGLLRVVPLLIADCDLPDYLSAGAYLDLRLEEDAQLDHLADYLWGRSAEIPSPIQSRLAQLVTAAGSGRWSRWSGDRLARSELVEVLRSLRRDDLDAAVEVARSMPAMGDRSHAELLALITACLPGAPGRAQRTLRTLVEAGLLEPAPALGRDGETWFASGPMTRAFLAVAQRSGAFAERLPPPEPERLSELLEWQRLGQRRAWSISGPGWSAWCLGQPYLRPARVETRTVTSSWLSYTTTAEVAQRPIDTIVSSLELDRTWAFAGQDDREPEVFEGTRSALELSMLPHFPREPRTFHYPEIDFTMFDDLGLLHKGAPQAAD